MRIVLAGQKAFGSAVYGLLRALNHEIVTVAAPATRDRTTSDGSPLPDRLRLDAERDGVPWIPAGTLRAHHIPDGTDMIIAAHSHDFLGAATRRRTRLGAIGYHPSLLPIHRGRDAVEWTIRLRDRVAGGSVYWLSDGVDCGDLAAQRHCFVHPDDTAATLWRRTLFPLGLTLLADVLTDLSAGQIVRVPQDAALATWEPSIGRTPIFRPELPAIGAIPGFTVRTAFTAALDSAR
jgi:methionyl-tRNA formyltransferase